jgi:hypothetical protein
MQLSQEIAIVPEVGSKLRKDFRQGKASSRAVETAMNTGFSPWEPGPRIRYCAGALSSRLS